MRHVIEKLLVGATVIAFSGGYAHANEFSARLNGFEELGAINAETGAILSDGKGTLTLQLDKKNSTITYSLTYSNVGTTPPGTGTVTQAHIHFGKEHVAGGVMVFLCRNVAGPAGVPACPDNTGTVTQAHIHFGKEHVAGGVMVFLCRNVAGPAGVPACPDNSGTVTGTITAASVIAIPSQNVSAGDFDALEDALTSNTAYVNVHTTAHPAGEIRGQIHREEDQDQQ